MVKAIKVNIGGSSFLLPDTHQDNYEFPTYIAEHKDDILKCVSAFKQWSKNPLSDMPPTPDMKVFKEKTGIIGAPFNMHDVDLYIADRDVDVVLEVDI